MDSARPLIFILCITFSFFAINHYFGLNKIETKKEELVTAQTISSAPIQKIETAPVESAPAPAAPTKSSGGFFSFFSFITEPFSRFLFFLLNTLYSFTMSWGFSIILLTIALRLMLYPINAWTIRTQIKTQMLGPKIAELKERYKDDPKRAQ